MGRWLDAIRSDNPELVWMRGLTDTDGDPLELGVRTDPALLATAEFAHAAAALAEMMRGAGPTLESSARRYDDLARDTRVAFAKRFVLPDGRLTSDTETAYALAIAKGALTGEELARAGGHLAAAVERAERHLTTGVRGTAALLPALSLVGRDDLAYALLTQETCPSWLCSVRNGATTVWERWDGFTRERGFTDEPSNSFNHYAFGAVGEWMYDAIGGIALDAAAPAGRHVLVRPRPGGGIRHARARYDSRYGPISTDWTLDQGFFRLKIAIPAGSHATVTLPFGGNVTESRVALAESPGIRIVEATGRKTVVTAESGTYDFVVDAR
jgi:alpha-L-rhamnosidase